MRSFEEDLKTARLDRAALLLVEVMREVGEDLAKEPKRLSTVSLIPFGYEDCQCMRYPCPHSGTAVFPLHYYR